MDLAATSQVRPAARGEVRLLVGDCREQLRGLLDRSVDCVVTSPPYYSLRDYRVPLSIWPARRSLGEGGGGDPDCDHAWGPWREAHDEREGGTAGKTRTTDRA